MTTWNSAGYPPPGGYPNQQYPGGGYPAGGYPGGPQGYPGVPPAQSYPGAPPTQGYPGAPPTQSYPGGLPHQGGPSGPPTQGFSAPPQGFIPGYAPPPSDPYGSCYGGQPQPGEATPFSVRPDMYGTPYAGGEDGEIKGFDFSDQSIRRGFIRKVYSILMVQLMITTGFIAWFLFHLPTKRWVHSHHELFYIALAIMIVTLIAMACCDSVRRKSPMNFVFLFLFTLAQSFMLGVTASRFQSQEVILAVGITAAVCLGLTLFAFQTKWDFTLCGGVLFVILIVFVLFGIIAIFIPGKIMTLVYASIGAVIFSIYLVYDTQLMLGGQHKYAISPEEYIFAALNLYLDIINIFMYILAIIGASRD